MYSIRLNTIWYVLHDMSTWSNYVQSLHVVIRLQVSKAPIIKTSKVAAK